jgi:hypothetical protein
MHVLIVNLNLKDMTDAAFRSMANEVAPAFASVPGLQAYRASDLGKGAWATQTSQTSLRAKMTGTKQQNSSVPVALQQMSQ